MIESIWQSFLYILSEGPWTWIFRWMFYSSYNDDFSWKKFGSFFIFLSILSSIYFFCTAQYQLAWGSLITAFELYVFTPDYDDAGGEHYPTWKFTIIMIEMITLFVGLVLLVTKYKA